MRLKVQNAIVLHTVTFQLFATDISGRKLKKTDGFWTVQIDNDFGLFFIALFAKISVTNL